jgi:SMP-30/Gluconolactonase/LRE-like region
VAFVEKLCAKPRRIASLYVGRREGDRLLYAGKVRSGYTEAVARDLRERLDPFIRKDSAEETNVECPRAYVLHFGGTNEARRNAVTAAAHQGHGDRRRRGGRGVAVRAGPGGDGPVAPPSTVTSPPRDFGPTGAPTTYFWDPDVIAVDPAFNRLAQPNSAIKRLWTGALWSEGPAWSGEGRYLVWSDIPNNRQLRWLGDDGHVSVFRLLSNNSNGNTFDFQGRQISCEHLTRRVVRYELDGSITVIAEAFNGTQLNSPNDAVPHPDGSIWFTDPPYGAQLYEGTPDAAGGPSNLREGSTTGSVSP